MSVVVHSVNVIRVLVFSLNVHRPDLVRTARCGPDVKLRGSIWLTKEDVNQPGLLGEHS